MTDLDAVTGLVERKAEALVAPGGTVVEAGTVTAVLSLDSVTTAPPSGAGPVSVTVALALPPPWRVAGLTVTALSDAAGWTGVGVGVGVGVGATTVHPDSRTFVGDSEPSLTSTVQSAGGVYPNRSILKSPEPLLVVIATPSTVIGLLAAARPSIRNRLPPTSARLTVTAACATSAMATKSRATMATAAHTARDLRPAIAFS